MVLLLTAAVASTETCTAAPAFPLTVLLASDSVVGPSCNGAVGYLNRCCTVPAKYAEKSVAVNSLAGVVAEDTVRYLQRRRAASLRVVVNAVAGVVRN